MCRKCILEFYCGVIGAQFPKATRYLRTGWIRRMWFTFKHYSNSPI